MTGLMGPLSAWEQCSSFCTHGGVCNLEEDHEGLHDSGFCQWADAQALTRDAADAVLASGSPEGAAVVALWDVMIEREKD